MVIFKPKSGLPAVIKSIWNKFCKINGVRDNIKICPYKTLFRSKSPLAPNLITTGSINIS